jgi:hypothetical protein
MTDFAATAVGSPINVAQKLGYQLYTLQLPTALGAGGTAWTGLSTVFSTVYGAEFDLCITSLGIQAAVQFGLVGTADDTNGGLDTASTISLVGYISGGSAAALTEAAATDLASVTAAPVLVWGVLK